MNDQFLRTQMLLGANAMERLRRSHVAVFGLGGVGSYAVEALVRSGVGELTLIDDDTVSPTNLNRQLEALHSTVGPNKTDALAARCRDINPDVRLHLICARYDAAHREDFFTARYDYILDAIDTVSSKLDLIQTAQARGLDVHEGDFGENFTTQGINLLSLPLGTQLKLGSDVLVEISQIGKVCHTRCAIYYLAGDCIFPHEGIFGVVLKGGEVHTGDDIQVVKLGDGSCSFTPAEALEEIEQARQEGTL